MHSSYPSSYLLYYALCSVLYVAASLELPVPTERGELQPLVEAALALCAAEESLCSLMPGLCKISETSASRVCHRTRICLVTLVHALVFVSALHGC